jgi:L-fuconolactonase
MRIDSHQHFWDPARKDYGWIDTLEGEAARRLRRPILPPELAPQLARERIDRTVLVQAAASEAEAGFLLSLADEYDFIAGVVAWLDMEASDFEQRLARLERHSKFVGVRPMIHDLADPEWMLRASVRRSFAVLQARGVCFDFLVRPPHLAPMLRILGEFPELRAVLDHIGKPNIAARQLEPWRSEFAAIARHPNVFCKLSGMLTEADHERWVPADLEPYVRHALECFTPERCMFGSDWPVCTLAGSYGQVLAALEQSLGPLGLAAAARERIFAGTAAEFYRLFSRSSGAATTVLGPT